MNDVTITMSATAGKLFAALAKAQAEMGAVAKDSTNPHFKNRYASLAACIEATKILNKHGIAVVQPPAAHGPDGVLVATILGHESGEWLRGELYMPATKKDPQGFGSALSYARRYCLCSTANLATDDDDGTAATRPEPPNGKRAEEPKPPGKAESDPVEQELTGLYTAAQDANAIATADATAARYSQAKKLTQAARERLLKLRATAVERVSSGQAAGVAS